MASDTRRFTAADQLPRAFLAFLLAAAGGCQEGADAPTAPESTPALTMSSTPVFFQVSGGTDHTCAITTDNRAFCWGTGLLGDGTPLTLRVPPVAVAGGTNSGR
jgi:hypothetical protein